MSKVLCIRSRYDQVEEKIRRIAEVQDSAEVARQARITVKINLCDARTWETGTITHPAFLDALLGYLRDLAPSADLAVVESDGISVLADDYRDWFGIGRVLQKWDARWVNLTRDSIRVVPVSGRHLKEIPVPETVFGSFYISLAKLKTNLLPTITGALKNQYGCLPMVDKFKYHDHLTDVIHDINLAMRPSLSIVDGIVAMGGIQGPSFGTPIRAGFFLVGKDPVAVDAAMARAFGYSPRRIGHVRACARAGIGSLRYDLVGDPVPVVDYENRWLESAVFQLGSKLKKLAQKRPRQKTQRARADAPLASSAKASREAEAANV